MNYQKHYDLLVARAQARQLPSNIYVENHHIIPRCMGGIDEGLNIVKLTAEEHYVAHQLLIKIYPNNHKLIYAAILMATNSNGKRNTNKVYGWLRRANGNARKGIARSAEVRRKISEARTGQPAWNKGKESPNKGRKMPEEQRLKLMGRQSGMQGKNHSEETKLKQSLANKGRVFTPEHRARLSLARRKNLNDKL